MEPRESEAAAEAAIEVTRIAAMIQRAPLLLGLIDSDGLPCYLSPSATRLLTGGDEREIIDAQTDEERKFRIHPDDLQTVVDAHGKACDTPNARVAFAARTLHDDGTWRHFEGVFQNFMHDPEVDGVILSISDVTDRVHAENDLRTQLNMEATLASIARDLMRADTEGSDAVQEALTRIAELVGAQRASVFRLSGEEFERTHAWSAPDALLPRVERVSVDSLDEWRAEMATGLAASLDHDQMRIVTRKNGTPGMSSSILAVALVARDETVGLVSFGHDEELHVWPSGAVECAEQFATLLTTAIERKRAEELQRQSQDALQATADRFRRLVQSSPDLFIVLDPAGRITFASPAAKVIFGYEPEEIIGSLPWDLVHPDDEARAVDAFIRAVEDFQPELIPLRVRHKDGTWIPVETIGSPLFDDPLLAGLLITIRDVRERERMAAELRAVEVRFQQAWDHAPIGMGFTGRDGSFLDVNPAFCTMLGYTEEELLTKCIPDVIHPDDLGRDMELYDAMYRGDQPGYALEKRFQHKDGSWRWVRVTVTVLHDATGTPFCSLAQVEDIAERREFEERLAYEASHDALTGLPLRKLLLDHLELALASSRRSGTHVGVLFIDLDHFKRINDSMGHAAGDVVLVEVAERLRQSLRDGDTPGRFGGDEFVIVCPTLDDPRDVVQVADRILEQLSEPFCVDGIDLYAGASIGIAVAEPGIDAETLLRQADTAAYRAKDHGRNRYEIFDAELRASVFARLQTEVALRRALDHNEFLVLYQPIVTAITNELVGFEALVRWDRPGHGRLAPAEFLPVAEETGLIVPLGRHVLSNACTQLAAWQKHRPERSPFLAVNLSPRQLLAPELVDDIREAVDLTGVDPQNLWLELPETLLVHDAPQLVSLLSKLRDIGVQISLDDFGTGFSSLTHLRFLPVGVIKIDRSFIFELGRNAQASTIVGAVISLAHALGMRVIAEGVETAEQLEILRALNCDWIQGFYFSTPLLPAHATQVLTSGRLRST